VIVDERVHPFVADPHPHLSSGDVTIAGDCVTVTGETGETLPIDMEQIAWAGPFVQPRPLAGRLRRPRDLRPSQRPSHGRVCVTGLTGDQPWTPGRPRGDPRASSCPWGWSGARGQTAGYPPMLLSPRARTRVRAGWRVRVRRASTRASRQHPSVSQGVRWRSPVPPNDQSSSAARPSRSKATAGSAAPRRRRQAPGSYVRATWAGHRVA
jgi:hypothetical protein